ncbi:MAG: hypothetical protein E7177_00225 [Erysipelotrichaceae bacterium]|nr:hypothetical protein [Erysipelotrichaceae bacterium]
MKTKDLEKYEMEVFNLKIELERAEEELIASKMITFNYIPVNPWLGRFIGFDAALMLGVIFEKAAYLKKVSGNIKEDISMSINYVKQITGMGEERQKKAINVLKEHDLIECWNRGSFPKRRHFSIKVGKYKEFNEKLKVFIESEADKKDSIKESFRKNMKHLREDWLEKQNQYNSINHQLGWCVDYKIPTKPVENFTF